MKHASFPLLSLSLSLLFIGACRKADSTNGAPSTSPAAPAVAAGPMPSFSAAEKIGMFAYAKNNQSHDQQLRDEYDCYAQIQQQTGIDPDTPAPAGPSSAEVQAAQQQAAANAPQAQGGRARGAGRGAARGAVIGGIAGDAGKGAAIGAAAGTVRGGKQQRQANEQSKQQAAQSAGEEMQQQSSQAQTAYNKQMDTFKRGFSSCMDARGYSVK
jgi:hypothetical protein